MVLTASLVVLTYNPWVALCTAGICRGRVACSTLGSNALKVNVNACSAPTPSATDYHPSLITPLHCSKSSLGNFGASMSAFIFHFTFHAEEAERSQLFHFQFHYSIQLHDDFYFQLTLQTQLAVNSFLCSTSFYRLS